LSHSGFMLILAGTSAKLCPRRSCRGARTPLRLNRRRMAAHALATVATMATSSIRLRSVPGTDAFCRRCMSNNCQLTSRPANPRERKAGSWTGSCSRPQARRRRASGHAPSESCSELALVVAATAVTEFLVISDSGLSSICMWAYAGGI
jgi:hypothetical protein